MAGSGLTALQTRLVAMGIRGKVLGIAGLGLCTLPCVLLVLIWRDNVAITGVAPFLAICSATIAAIAALIGLDLILRPIFLTGKAFDRLLGGNVPVDLPLHQPGPAGQLVSDAQRLMDELIALRAEQSDDPGSVRIVDRASIVATLMNCTQPVQGVVIMRLANAPDLPSGAKGEEVSDFIFQETAQRLRKHFGAKLRSAIIGRYEMAFVVPLQHADLAASTDFQQSLDAVFGDLARPIRSDDICFVPKFLSGVAISLPEALPEQSIDQVFQALDAAQLKSPVVIFSQDLSDKSREMTALSIELRQAIRHEEFELFYQPIMDIGRARPVGAEALIRWHSPARGFVAPDVFIPLAEANGLIDPIGLWVLRQACKEAANWDPEMRVSVNLGARQFLDEDLTWQVSEAIEAAGLQPDQLEIELTEAVAMLDQTHTQTTVAALRDLGVGIAIEDFGMCRANFGMIRATPFTTLKIDREHVADVHQNQGSQAICDALIALGNGLGFGVVAEGTEREEEVGYLSQRGCFVFQGYHFARPVAAHVLSATFENLRLRQLSVRKAG